MAELSIGQRCTANELSGIIRFVGETQFAPGIWIGVELDNPEGKNNGTVQDILYFDCRANHGVFVRPAKVVLEEVKKNIAVKADMSKIGSRTVSTEPTSHAGKNLESIRGDIVKTPSKLSRPVSRASISSGDLSRNKLTSGTIQRRQTAFLGSLVSQHRATTTIDRQTLTGSPQNRRELKQFTPSHRRTLSNSQVASYTSKVGRSTDGISPQTIEDRDVSTIGEFQAIIPPAARASGAATGIMHASQTPIESFLEAPHSSMSRFTSDSTVAETASDIVPIDDEDPSSRVVSTMKAPERRLTTEADDLRAKLLRLEVQRKDDLRRLSQLGALENEKEAWSTIRTKLRDKLQAQQYEIRNLKERVKSLEKTLDEFKATTMVDQEAHGDSNELLEMAMLDREMAEEELDQLKNQKVELLSRIEELMLEVDILKIQQDESTSTNIHSTAGSKALELQNERFREALIRLKEITTEQETTITALNIESEKNADELGTLRSQLESSRTQLQDMDSLVDELRSQIDISLGAEEMLENLTVRNLALGEQLEQCKRDISDLESLKELNDELEEVHNQAQKELLMELELRDAIVAEQTSRLVSNENSISEYGKTIEKFRSLVDSLQQDIDEMKSNGMLTALKTAESLQRAQELGSENAALRLRQRKSTAHSLNLDIKQLEATLAIEHLAIMQEYLPLSYELDQNSVEAFLITKRLTSLCKILHYELEAPMDGSVSKDRALITKICHVLVVIALKTSSLSRLLASATLHEFAALKDLKISLEPISAQFMSIMTSIQTESFSELELERSLTHALDLVEHLHLHYFSTTKLPSCHLSVMLWSVEAHLSRCSKILGYAYHSTGDTDIGNNTNETLGFMLNGLGLLLQKMTDIDGMITDELHVELSLQALVAPTADAKSLSIIMSDLLQQSQLLAEAFCSLQLDPEEVHNDQLVTIPSRSRTDQLQQLQDMIDDIQKACHSLEDLVRTEVTNTDRNQISTPWKQRGIESRANRSDVKESEQQLIRTQNIVRELTTQLQVKEKALEEEKMKTQALDRRLLENSRAADMVKTLEHNELKFDLDRKAYEEAIEELTEEIEHLQEQISTRQLVSAKGSTTEAAYSNEVTQAELKLLGKTIVHLNSQISKQKLSLHSNNLDFLTKPFFDITQPNTNTNKNFLQAVHRFYGNLRLVDFSITAPAETKWMPRREACGAIHFIQEQDYAGLLGLKKQMLN